DRRHSRIHAEADVAGRDESCDSKSHRGDGRGFHQGYGQGDGCAEGAFRGPDGFRQGRRVGEGGARRAEMNGGEVKEAVAGADIRRLYPVICVLRPHIASADDLVAGAERQRKQSGWRLIYVEDEGEPVAAASFRISEWLAWGKALYVDDLVAL